MKKVAAFSDILAGLLRWIVIGDSTPSDCASCQRLANGIQDCGPRCKVVAA